MTLYNPDRANNPDRAQAWPLLASDGIIADSHALGWQGLEAFACKYTPPKTPLFVANDQDYLTVEINMQRSTSVSFQFGDAESSNIQWNPGDILIYPNTERSKWVWDSPHHTAVFFLPISRLKQLMMEDRISGVEYPALLPGVCTSDATLRNLLQLLSSDLMGDASNGQTYVRSLVDATLIHLAKNYITENQSLVPAPDQLSLAQLELVRKYVTDNVDTALSVSDLADAAGVKAFEFPRAFRQTTGITPYQYVLKERIDWAEQLLRTTDLSLAEISYTAGFSSQSHFTRTFRKQKSVTPQTFRSTVN